MKVKNIYCAELWQNSHWIAAQDHTNKKTALKEYNQLKKYLKNKPGCFIRLVKYTIETEKKVNETLIIKNEYVGKEY